MVENTYKVNKKQWKKWNDAGRYVFNNLYEDVLKDQEVFSHPKSAVQINEYWTTTAWNVAWVAADHTTKITKDRG